MSMEHFNGEIDNNCCDVNHFRKNCEKPFSVPTMAEFLGFIEQELEDREHEEQKSLLNNIK